MRKKALIIGITGQDGSYLTEFLLNKRYEIYGLTRDMKKRNLNNIETVINKISLIEGDLRDEKSLIKAIKKSSPDEVYNLASYHRPTDWKHYFKHINITGLGTIRLLEIIRKINKDVKFFQASTSEIFGKPKKSPQNENTPIAPINLYAIAKAYSHFITNAYRKKYGIFACCGILYNHESPRRGLQFVTRKITNSVAKIKLGMESELRLGNLEAKRDWGYAPEYVKSMWLMLQQDKPDDYVIATGETHSVKEFAQEAFNVVGLNWEDYIKVDKRFLRPLDVNILKGDSSKAKEKLGWRPRKKFKDIVKEMVESDIEILKRSFK